MGIKGLTRVSNWGRKTKLLRFSSRKDCRSAARSIQFKIREMYGEKPIYLLKEDAQDPPDELFALYEGKTTIWLYLPRNRKVCGF